MQQSEEKRARAEDELVSTAKLAASLEARLAAAVRDNDALQLEVQVGGILRYRWTVFDVSIGFGWTSFCVRFRLFGRVRSWRERFGFSRQLQPLLGKKERGGKNSSSADAPRLLKPNSFCCCCCIFSAAADGCCPLSSCCPCCPAVCSSAGQPGGAVGGASGAGAVAGCRG